MESGCGHTAGLLIEALNPLAVQQIDSRARTVYAITAVRDTHNYDYEPFHGPTTSVTTMLSWNSQTSRYVGSFHVCFESKATKEHKKAKVLNMCFHRAHVLPRKPEQKVLFIIVFLTIFITSSGNRTITTELSYRGANL